MDQRTPGETLTLGEWTADYRSGRLTRGAEVRDIEPKVMDLLFLLASRPGRVFSRDEIGAALWPTTTVDEDALSRCVFKLRRALDDGIDARRYIETIPKRGYRLIEQTDEGAPLRQHAEDFYFQYTRADNEAAMILYERALAANTDDPVALAGLANGLVQRAVRWLGLGEGEARTNLQQALDSGVLSTPAAQQLLSRAEALGDRAVTMAPNDPAALRALGLVMAATRRFTEARTLYERALAADPKAWGALINLADIDGMEGDRAASLTRLERAHAIMADLYPKQAVQIRPWHAALGVLIAARHLEARNATAAEDWYRRVLATSPLHEAATAGLAGVLAGRGEVVAAQLLCREFIARVGKSTLCEAFLAGRAG
jgi:transcriptional activator of cad operon